jgi:c-di-GMP-binding flagellar brake protein YcgR
MTAPGTKLASKSSRKYPRFAIDLRMKVRVFRNGEFSTCWGRSTELGRDGIGATLTGDLEVGEIVSLELPLPLTAHSVKIRAVIRYRQGQRYGFEFLLISEAQRQAVHRACEMLSNQ